MVKYEVVYNTSLEISKIIEAENEEMAKEKMFELVDECIPPTDKIDIFFYDENVEVNREED